MIKNISYVPPDQGLLRASNNSFEKKIRLGFKRKSVQRIINLVSNAFEKEELMQDTCSGTLATEMTCLQLLERCGSLGCEKHFAYFRMCCLCLWGYTQSSC